jgi:hypothetical protein
MKRTFLVLALAVLGFTGCQAMGPKCGQSCSTGCDQGCQSSHMSTMKYAPRPGGLASNGVMSGHGGNLETSCPGGGECCAFNRYHGSECGPGYPQGPYDCSPCNSPDWGCTGHRHPFGYKTGRECYCQNDGCNGQQGGGQQCGGQQCVCPRCGRGYCMGGPGVGCGCPFCGCGPSGDQNYNFNPGPPVAQTAYPYYTLRGPRDFLMNNPPSIGPY